MTLVLRPRQHRLALRRGVLVAIGVIGPALALATLAHRLTSDPKVPLLVPEGGAHWIVADEPYHLSLRRPGTYQARFRKSIQIESQPSTAPLTLRAFRIAAVMLDGALVEEPRTCWSDWKTPVELDLAQRLTPGPHTIEISVANENGPAALLAHSSALGLVSDESWEASLGGKPFARACLAHRKRPPELAERFPGSIEGLTRNLPLVVFVFLAVAGAAAWVGKGRALPRWTSALPPAPALVRWVLLAAWLGLGANNILRIPETVGFDAIDHFYYIQHVALHRALPLAPEGWQMFQSPLYYIISAPLYLGLRELFDPLTVVRLLRVVPLLAGAAQIEICFRALRRVFPGKLDLQSLGLLIGGLLPMNIYLSHGLGNEPLTACISGALLVHCFALLAGPGEPLTPGKAARMGLLLGLALLGKVTSVLLILPMAFCIAWAARGSARPARSAVGLLGTAFGCAALVSGWYYARNWIALGSPFVSGWGAGAAVIWWQDPGFRCLEHLTSFGTAIARPIYSATAGFWDSLYSTFWTDGYLSMMAEYEKRPPWNYGLLSACAGLSILTSAAIVLGAMSSLWPRGRTCFRAAIFATVTASIYLGAMFSFYASLGIYSVGKATYLSSATVCFAVLAAAGLDRMVRGPVSRALVSGAVAAWAVTSYLGYVVI